MKKSIFSVSSFQSAIDRAKTLPPTRRLFGDFWYENELTILFGSSNTGKSILGYQIAHCLSTGTSVDDTCFKNETSAQEVYYIDFELSSQQLLKRYPNGIGNDNLKRVTLDTLTFEEYQTYKDNKLEMIESLIKERNIKALIIDNLSNIDSDMEKGSDASFTIGYFRSLQDKYKTSILVVAHTPKLPKRTSLEISHLSGAAAVGNLVDAVFALGHTNRGDKLKYLKQIKLRSAEFEYGEDNVVLMEIGNNQFLRFIPLGTEKEFELIKFNQSISDEELKRNVLAEVALGTSYRDIASKYGIAMGTITKWKKEDSVRSLEDVNEDELDDDLEDELTF